MPASATACSGATSGSSSWMIERPAGSGAGLREACGRRAVTGEGLDRPRLMNRESQTDRAALKKHRVGQGRPCGVSERDTKAIKNRGERPKTLSSLFSGLRGFWIAAQLHLVEYRAVVDNRATGRRCAAEPVAERVSSGGTPASRADWACRARTSAARAFR